jgi:hypothetical protein
MTHTNPNTNTSSNVEVNDSKSSSYFLGYDLYEISDMLRKANLELPYLRPSLTFFLWRNDKDGTEAKRQFNALIKLFNIQPNEIRIEHTLQRVYATKIYGNISVNIHADAKDVLEKETVTTFKSIYLYDNIPVLIESED